jgi:hypothetical protein
MAQIITVKNDLKEYKNKYRKKYILLISLLAIVFFSSPIIGPINIIPFLILGLMFRSVAKKYQIYKSGYEGETKVKKILENLPEDYTVITDTTIKLGDQQSQIDNIIVGPNGVFVLEVKNFKGFIEVLEDKMWKQKKKSGLTYKNEFYSPVKQVKTHVYRLSQFLKSMGYSTWINCAVLFSHPEVKVSRNELDNVPIFSGKEGHVELFDFIENKEAVFSDKDCQRITSFILDHQKTNFM